jgi:hypothetical protein
MQIIDAWIQWHARTSKQLQTAFLCQIGIRFITRYLLTSEYWTVRGPPEAYISLVTIKFHYVQWD